MRTPNSFRDVARRNQGNRRSYRRSALGRGLPLAARSLVLEPLEQRALLTVTFGLVGGVPTFIGDGANDSLTLQTSAAGDIEYIANGGPAADTGVAVAAISQVNVDLGAGDDTLTIDNGGPGGCFANGSLVINYDGGDGFDSLALTGGAATSNMFTPGPAPGSGTTTMVMGGVTPGRLHHKSLS